MKTRAILGTVLWVMVVSMAVVSCINTAGCASHSGPVLPEPIAVELETK